MDFGGVLGADAPDPELEQRATVRALGFDVAGLVAQRHLEDSGSLGVQTSESDGVLVGATVSRQYTLWRNPDDRDDPVNLAVLDDERRRSLEEVPPWPRPDWLVATVERLRYPMLWEAVQTHWSAPGRTRPTAAETLVQHVQNVLVNQYRDEHALPDLTAEHTWPTLVDERSVQSGHPVLVDGAERPGLLLDTDPFVLGLAAELDDGRLLTAVLPRDELSLLTVAFDSAVQLDRIAADRPGSIAPDRPGGTAAG
ncbi:hypothetical protein [Curtobacterium sp. MCBD17_008]|uniref:hypothetical protein n=1 Tax=Curtobacterium sp. MCBD17_008 TaxID=2175656 RepID=UPI000DAAC0FD|nr:hypothetical protein [Curtobacterium sp. MCBD17_008]PZE91934.1 hypothetical protein DEI95_09255 [Curtobacterium sp. MCBD17_008]